MINEEEKIVFEALQAAKEAFQKHLEDNDYDPAYVDYKFTAYLVDINLEKRLGRVEIESELKEEK